MKRLFEHIQNRNKILPPDLKTVQFELQNIFHEKFLTAGVSRPGYFDDFYRVLEKYKSNGSIFTYMITEEEYTDSGVFYKLPVIDITKKEEQSNYRIFLTPIL